MNPGRLLLVLATPLLMAAGPQDGVPDLDLSGTCRAAPATPDRSGDACLRDERAAQSELRGQWSKIPVEVRRSCLDEVRIGGSPSYVELLTCAQMNQWSKEEPNPTAPGEATRPGTKP